MTGPAGDVTANYLAKMRDEGLSWGDLADQFDRDAAAGRALDGGANARRMAAWARSQEEAGRERQRAAEDPQRPDPGAPDHATPGPPARTVTPPRAPSKRGGASTPPAVAVDATVPPVVDAVDAVGKG
jgi:hypothetical protein